MRDQWIDWLQDKQRHFFYGVILVIAVFFVAFQIAGKFHKGPTSNFFAANQVFEKWLLQKEPFDNLESALQKHPELETKFGARIAEKFIAQNDGESAEPFASRVFQRVFPEIPEHSTFAQGSLLIAKGNLEEALTMAVSLKERLDNDALLYGFNLVRIASLCRALDVSAEEQVALRELEGFIEEKSEAALLLNECFKEGTTTLSDYISQRKTQ
ncbi:MAG: hypothetical protein KR126chlam1_01137 [Chlamydiae bacterium]|nr:hypothetical protein [Chlamydiota bacterium]